MKTDKQTFKPTGLVSSLAAALLVLLFAGCRTDKDKIVFSDEGKVPQASTNSLPPPKPSLSKVDQTKIEEQVFAYLLTRHFWDDGDYSAIFLQGDESEVAALRKEFPNHVPPIKPCLLYTSDAADDLLCV